MTTYTIGELANLADVTARTIRYYVSEQVLPAPDKDGRVALYDEDHLARLQLVKILKGEYLPLQEIRILLENLDSQAVVDLLQEKRVTADQMIDQTGAKAYLQALLNPLKPEAEPATMMRHRAVKRQRQPATAQPSAKADDLPESLAEMKEAHKIASNVPTPFANVEPEPARWQRVQLSPDIELHIREAAVNTTQWPKLKQLISFAHQLFNS